MKIAHLIRDDGSCACKGKKGGSLNWDISEPNAPICKTCFNYFSKSGDHVMACIDNPWLENITVMEMSRVKMMSV